MQNPKNLAGVAGSLGASTLFATLYYYTSLLEPLSGQQIYGWRILLTAPCLALLLVAIGRWGAVRGARARRGAEPRLWLALPLSSALVGMQLWLFMWAPINGHGLDVSLGYFLLPLTLVLTGRLVFGEAISRLQRLACLLAAVGVGNQLLLASSLSWPSRLATQATSSCGAGAAQPTWAACGWIWSSACRLPRRSPWAAVTP
ncbi:RarD protein [Stutzerimonas stutzeri CCUG 29243]|uniref:RarD protein n=1 Tax=Stutzerimonas stutzeri CCUG 29243 TaxID=1196835 RepID=I4CW62_STUST|nr:RarD protein [Stutzerimonas stutzeri CCUG 29243]